MRRLLDFFRGRAAPEPAAAPTPVEATPPILDDLRDFIGREVAGGYYDDDAVLRNAADIYADELEPDTLRTMAQAYLREALVAHRAEQAGWPEETDCDRLDAAFDALEAQGVVCRQNFTCCGNCGAAEIGDEMAAMEAEGFVVRGYAFFHAQDTEAAVDGGGLYLSYGAAGRDDDASVAIGRLVVVELTAQGLDVDWSGDLGQRIGVTIDWNRRR